VTHSYRAESELVSKVKGNLAKDFQKGLQELNKNVQTVDLAKAYKLKKNEVRKR